MCKCKSFKKTITFLILELNNAKNGYEIVIENKIKKLEEAYENAKYEIKALKLELENNDKALFVFVNENSALKMSIDEKQK